MKNIPNTACVCENLQIRLSDKQHKAFKALLDKQITSVGYGGAAGGGKSYLGVMWLTFLADTYPGVTLFMGRKTLKNLKRTTLNSFWKFLTDYGLAKGYVDYKETKSQIIFPNGSVIYLLDLEFQPSDPLYSRFGSLELTAGFIDESNEVPKSAIDMLATRLGRNKNDEYHISPVLLETFNPDHGHVYSRFYRPYSEGSLPSWRVFVPSKAVDNPKLSPHYIAQLKKSDKKTQKRLLEGNFDYDLDENLLFQPSDISLLFKPKDAQFMQGKRYMSVDVAGPGEDKTVALVFQGMKLIDFVMLDKNTAPELIDMVKRLAIKHTIQTKNIVIDSDGMGYVSGFIPYCLAFKAGSSALPMVGDKNPYFKNLKAQCFFKLADVVQKKQLDLSVLPLNLQEMLAAELMSLRQKENSAESAIAMEPKTKVKERLGRSPDIADALMMSMLVYLQMGIDLRVLNEKKRKQDFRNYSFTSYKNEEIFHPFV